MAHTTDPMQRALELVAAGVLRVDAPSGQVYKTVVHELYTYERPVGDLQVNGYVRVYLPGLTGVTSRKPSSVYAHRLIWTVTEGPIGAADQINHRNGVKRDNRLENLEVVDASGNLQHAYDTGLKRRAFGHHKAVPEQTVRQVLDMLAAGHSQADTATALGVGQSTVSRIKTGRHFSATL